MQKIIILTFALCIIFICFAGCRTTQTAGDESLVQARIQHAIDAERNRWITELSRTITGGLAEADQRVGAIADGQRASIEAAREYRSLVLATLDKLQQLENEISRSMEDDVDSDMGKPRSHTP